MKLPTDELKIAYQGMGYKMIAGLDEAGKGAWAGPVVSGAVILPVEVELPKLTDSKLISESIRESLYTLITEQAIAWGAGIIPSKMIDQAGLAEAHRMSMRAAVANMQVEPDLLLVDGRGIYQLGFESVCIVKGDQKERCISAASIIAKVTRDRIMKKLDEQYPDFGFKDHKGYGTKKHQDALAEFGVIDIHRKSYKPIIKRMQESLV